MPPDKPHHGSNACSTDTLPYRPLDEDVDCTRFVRIEPATNNKQPIECRLLHIAFGDRPAFEALSYVWGNEAVTKEILLDDVKHRVTKNLYDALRYLRDRGDNMIYWIDALSINQQDIAERNKQLRIMWQIYFRASRVIIWLGQEYTKFEMPTKWVRQESMKPKLTTQSPSSLGQAIFSESELETLLVQKLVRDEYWTRLWIIQEVGQSRKRQVCFGHSAIEWDELMASIASQDCEGKEVALRLDRQLQEKYSGAHTLRRLLEDHQNARCKDPKDKVYGLIGLAADAHGFPLDYNKSLMDIWIDTMEWMNRHHLFNKADRDTDIIHVGALVRFLLMGQEPTPLQDNPFYLETEAPPAFVINGLFFREGQNAFQLEGRVLGCISSIGPSTEEMISSTKKVDQWEQRVQDRYRDDIGAAYRESRQLLNVILETDETTLTSLCSNRTSLKWIDNPDVNEYQSKLSVYRKWVQERKSKSSSQSGTQRQWSFSMKSGSPNLYQLHRPQSSETPWKMGILSSQAQAGDLVCWIRGTKKALVVRTSPGGLGGQQEVLQIHGTALATEDIASEKADHDQRLGRFEIQDVLTLCMDAKMVYVLL